MAPEHPGVAEHLIEPAQQALDGWTADPILAGSRRLDELLARTARHADRDDADAVLRALLRRSSHDELAARTVLQALVPGLAQIARKVGAQHDSEQAAEVVAVAWTKIRCGDWSLKTKVATAAQPTGDRGELRSRSVVCRCP